MGDWLRVRGGRAVGCAVACAVACIVLAGAPLGAQAPMVTDDAAVAPYRVSHVELFGQFARLPLTARPATRQQTGVVTLGWGAAPRLEVGVDFPLIAILQPGADVRGVGDLNLTAKYLLGVQHDSAKARWALAPAIELPTGSARRGLGSGVVDVSLNLIRESAYRRAVVRMNFGLQVTGNTLTGRVGANRRAPVFTAGASASHPMGERVTLAAEVSGYQGRSPSAADREARAQGAILFALTGRHAIAASVQRGWLASPPMQWQIGLVADAW